ncbi:MAG: D-tyrosyl-tRNA(Tyr) deacylase [Synergistales bacterium]|nr:D-tyrosyl-tRNA(Tyr) deacylase [Synergistales bacterium]
MRALVQRVNKAQVTVDNKITGKIEKGFCVFIGVTHGDTEKHARWLAEKITGLRVFDDGEGKMNLSLKDVHGDLLVVSQFTLYGDCRKGRRPSFVQAADPTDAEILYKAFIDYLSEGGLKVESGLFQTYMTVSLDNDGPVTLMIDTPEGL